MRNPLRSEADAFRFVWLTIGFCALVVAGSALNRWVGLAVFLVLSVYVLRRVFRRTQPDAPQRHAPAASPPDEHRILVVANETVGGPELLSEIAERAGDRRARVLVVCPALNSPLRHWANDEDQARGDAQARLARSVESMRATGLEVEGEVGDGDPLQAIEDAVRTFQPDELIVSTHPAGRSHWLERGVVDRARERFEIPLTHVVVDLDADADDAPAQLSVAIEQVDPLPLRAELRDVHRSALGAGALSDEWAQERLPLHAAREDFVFLAAREEGAVVAFGYGYTGEAGQWWTERVSLSLSPEQRAEWLEPPHYEIVELHVRPSAQRRGLGSALLAQLLTRQRHDRALLSTQAGSRKARGFYAKNGWSELAPVDFGTGYPPYLVLGKRLR